MTDDGAAAMNQWIRARGRVAAEPEPVVLEPPRDEQGRYVVGSADGGAGGNEQQQPEPDPNLELRDAAWSARRGGRLNAW